jgi:hypothetical protein
MCPVRAVTYVSGRSNDLLGSWRPLLGIGVARGKQSAGNRGASALGRACRDPPSVVVLALPALGSRNHKINLTAATAGANKRACQAGTDISSP